MLLRAFPCFAPADRGSASTRILSDGAQAALAIAYARVASDAVKTTRDVAKSPNPPRATIGVTLEAPAMYTRPASC